LHIIRKMSLALLAVFTLEVSLFASPVIDQSNLTTVTNLTFPGVSAIIGPRVSQAQTVTVGISGKLSRIDLQVLDESSFSGDLYVSIIRGSIIDPSSRNIGTTSIRGSSLPTYGTISSLQYFSFDLTGYSFDFDAGDIFSILLYTKADIFGGDKAVLWIFGSDRTDFSNIADYTGGANYISINDSPYEQTRFDRGFRTWVEPFAVNVPEPATGLIVLAGISGIVLIRRKSATRSG
jgi:hypothetical protein